MTEPTPQDIERAHEIVTVWRYGGPPRADIEDVIAAALASERERWLHSELERMPTPQDIERALEFVGRWLETLHGSHVQLVAHAFALERERVMTEKQKQVDYWGQRTEKAEAENARLREALRKLTNDICQNEAAMNAVSLSVFEDACALADTNQ